MLSVGWVDVLFRMFTKRPALKKHENSKFRGMEIFSIFLRCQMRRQRGIPSFRFKKSVNKTATYVGTAIHDTHIVDFFVGLIPR